MDRMEELQAELDRINHLADIERSRIKELEIQQVAYNRQRRHVHREDRQAYEGAFNESQKRPEELIAFIQAALQGLKKKITRDSKWTHKFNLDEKYNRQIQTEFYAGPIDDDSFIEPYPPRQSFQSIGVTAFEANVYTREEGGRLMRLVLKDGYTRECMESPHTRYQNCCKINCAVHMADKARQWHSRQAMREERAFQRTQRKEETAAAASSSTSETASGSSSKSKSQRKRRARGGRRRQGNGASSSREDHE
ncbi:hypothetical protein N0V85_009113 [Neurospora sp. IMI 360204]|nr:hypothetical protein N0V85_009113 [Neurospora sp. IMI 360204]